MSAATETGKPMLPAALPGQLGYLALAAVTVAAALVLPFDDYIMHILVQTATYAIAVFGLSVVLGLCGQINLAQAAFFGFGAYAVGLGAGDWHLSFWLSLALDGLDITLYPPHARTAAGLGRTFQNIRLFRSMTALENVVIGAEHPGNAVTDAASLVDRARSALAFVGLEPRALNEVTSFSYGHQRLIEIARALAGNPTLLLLDEPAAGLNSTEKVELRDLLRRIAAKGLTILIIDHDMTLVSDVAEHITVLNFGRRIADGVAAEVLRNPDVIAAYLGSGPP